MSTFGLTPGRQRAWKGGAAQYEHLRRMLEDSLRLDDAVERLEQLEDATDRLLRVLDHEVGRRGLPLQLNSRWRRSSDSSTRGNREIREAHNYGVCICAPEW